MIQPLKVLLVEDNPNDSELVLRELRRAGFDPEWSRVETQATFLEKLKPGLDIIISDFAMPEFNGLRALSLLQQTDLNVPFILVSGTIGEESAVEAMKEGAVDYLLKDRLVRLGPAVKQALEKRQLGEENLSSARALRDSEKRFRHLVQSLPAAVYTCDAEGRVTLFNRAAVALWGRTPEIGKELWGGAWKIYEANGEPMDVDHDPMARAIRERRSVRSQEIIIERPDGTRSHVLTYPDPLLDANGAIIGAVNMLVDLTQRREAEERVREQAQMLNHARDAIVVSDLPHRQITFWNKGAESMAGWTANEALGRSVWELIFANSAEAELIEEHILKTGEWRGEHHCITKDGRTLTVNGRATLIRDSAGQPKSILSIGTDITEQKQLEAQFLRAQRLESIGTLASGVAHDLNNILAPILMAAPLLRSDTLPAATRDSILSSIETAAQRGAAIVKQVLTFARGIKGERVLVQPEHLIKEIVKIAQETFPKSISVSQQTAASLSPLEGDPTQLHQVLLNLCVNARDAMPDGGKLRVTAENFTVDENYSSMIPDAKPGRHILIKVGDSGQGIPDSILNQIFDPFFTTKEHGKGTGLGLSTVAGIVKGHGGFIEVESRIREGTTFKIYLPAAQGHHAVPEVAHLAQPPRGDGELILIVDDETDILAVTETMLTQSNYRVLTATDGTEALAVFSQHRDEVSAVMTDIMMPYVDGVALARALRKMKPSLPIIASSGLNEEKRLAELKTLGVAVSLLKPYNGQKLLETLAEVLQTSAKARPEAVVTPA
jgi:PAS domain S-box-containing protein